MPLFARAGALLIASGMVLGAFGTHAMRGRLTSEKLHAWDTAASYAIYNGLGLLAGSLHPRFAAHRFAGPAILAGTIIFSGSIVALTLSPKTRIFGPITPVGGMIMIAGYISLAF
ncbi:DUF423-domain-containing protein [Exidia glandulosa HHB12029]|uniref:DUF423-domain-containing protein n=1 Tax=Exidia glandulosa HHB12029 TaxID=1314781 RepID=A0A165IZR0_EXIGL|nr:DUF423-domain-containing protein [Exidia glandulosa HHB12029]